MSCRVSSNTVCLLLDKTFSLRIFTISISPFLKSLELLQAFKIENAITESNLGINPQVDGQLIRLPIPKLSEERRKEIIKIASEYAENSKIAIRNIRREFIETSKNEKKESNLSEDDLKRKINDIQKITDENIEKIDKILETKKIDILKV